MLKKFEKHITENFKFLNSKKILIAISGGMDSVALTHILKNLNYNISLAHCNFQLRGDESDLDQQFVEKLANDLDTTYYIKKFDTKNYCKEQKTSTQIGARELRYNWFNSLCEMHHFDYILTAHHLNDVMETFFINLSRGTGIEGLTSIPAINKNVIRPLLVFSRQEIRQYITKNSLAWREDASNSETKYLRNKIRHHVIPELYALSPNFEENFKLTVKNLHQSESFIKQKTRALENHLFLKKNDLIYILKTDLAILSEYEIYNLFKPFGFNSSKEILKLTNTQSGKEIYTQTYCLLNNREHLILYQKKEIDTTEYIIKNTEDTKHLPIPLSFSKSVLKNTQNAILIDLKENPFPFVLRKNKEGDRFQPQGMRGQKKISKYFKDIKLSKIEKEQTWLLCNAKNKIIWIVGLRANQQQICKTENTNTIYINN